MLRACCDSVLAIADINASRVYSVPCEKDLGAAVIPPVFNSLTGSEDPLCQCRTGLLFRNLRVAISKLYSLHRNEKTTHKKFDESEYSPYDLSCINTELNNVKR